MGLNNAGSVDEEDTHIELITLSGTARRARVRGDRLLENAVHAETDKELDRLGGRHRSVAMAEAIGAGLRERGVDVTVEHWDVHKPVIQK